MVNNVPLNVQSQKYLQKRELPKFIAKISNRLYHLCTTEVDLEK
jgi:hypothetical protein